MLYKLTLIMRFYLNLYRKSAKLKAQTGYKTKPNDSCIGSRHLYCTFCTVQCLTKQLKTT